MIKQIRLNSNLKKKIIYIKILYQFPQKNILEKCDL